MSTGGSSATIVENASQLLNPTSPGFDANYVLQQLKKRPEMESFFRKYESTFNALISSYTNVERLSKKCEQLTQDILAIATKVKSAQKSVLEDQQLMVQIKQDIDKQWEYYEAAKQKDKESQAKLEELQEKCNQLQKELQLGAFNDDRKKQIEILEETEQKLRKDYEFEQTLKIGLINTVTRLQEQYDDLVKRKNNILQKIEGMTTEIREIEKLAKVEQTERDRAKNELDESKEMLRSKMREIEERKLKKEQGEKELQRYELKAADQSERTIKSQKHVDDLKLKLEKIEKEFKDLAKQTSKLSADNEKLSALIHAKEDSIRLTKEEQQQIVKSVGQKMKEKKKREERRMGLDERKRLVEKDVRNTKDSIMEMKRLLEFEKSKIEDLTHQKSLLDKSILKADKNLEEEENTLKVVDSKKRNVQLKFKAYVQMIEKKRQDIYKLKKEIDKYDNAYAEAKQRYDQSQEEIKIKMIESDELKKRIREGKEKHRQQVVSIDTSMIFIWLGSLRCS